MFTLQGTLNGKQQYNICNDLSQIVLSTARQRYGCYSYANQLEIVEWRGHRLVVPLDKTGVSYYPPTVTGVVRAGGRRITAADHEISFANLGGDLDGYSRWSRASNLFCNGQLKNFIVALLTVSPIRTKDGIKILIIGSKSMEGSGRWLPFFVRVLLEWTNNIEIHCYDPAEVEGVRNYVHQTKIARVEHHSAMFFGTTEKYDAVIDDSFISGKGLAPREYESPYWSRKIHGPQGEEGEVEIPNLWNMCFHEAEGRQFESSRTIPDTRWSSCNCSVCRVASDYSQNEDNFRMMRSLFHFCHPLGCDRYEEFADVQHFSGVYSALTRGELKSVETNADKRVVESISRLIPLTTVSPKVVRSYDKYETMILSSAQRKVMYRQAQTVPFPKLDLYALSTQAIYPTFYGKSIVFFGVSPSILGGTVINRVNSVPDIAFIANQDLVSSAYRYEQIWAPEPITVPGYLRTGDRHQTFYQWVRGKVETLPVEYVVSQPVVGDSGFTTDDDDDLANRWQERKQGNCVMKYTAPDKLASLTVVGQTLKELEGLVTVRPFRVLPDPLMVLSRAVTRAKNQDEKNSLIHGYISKRLESKICRPTFAKIEEFTKRYSEKGKAVASAEQGWIPISSRRGNKPRKKGANQT